MGADLIATWVVMDKDKKPDWKAAAEHLRAIPDDELVDLSWALDADDPQATAQAYLREAQELYEQGSRDTLCFEVRGATVFFLGGTSWGDSIDGMDAIEVLYATDAYKAAGFEQIGL